LKHQRSPVTCEESQQLAFGLGGAELLGAMHNPAQNIELLALLIESATASNQQCR
jgi:hypothetical protein